MHPRSLVPAAVLFAFVNIFSPPDAAPSPDPLRLAHDVVPTAEAVKLDLDARRTDYSGSVRIELAVESPADSFRLHARDMNLARLTLRRGNAVIPTTHASRP